MSDRAIPRGWARHIVCVLGLLAAVGVGGGAWADETPRRGGTFIIANTSDPVTLNPSITTTVQSHLVTSMIFNALVAYDMDLNPVPDLARAWTISPDGLTYQFDLVRDATWHDGTPFTSADVKYTFEEVLTKYHPLGKTAYAALGAILTPDRHTVVFKLKYALPAFMNIIGAYAGSILPKHLYEGTDPTKNPRNLDPIGTGPFRFKEWVKGSHVVLERNPSYFKAGKPYLDRVVVKAVPDTSARMVAFESGEVDYIPYFGTPLHEVARIRKMKDGDVVFAPGFSTIFMLWFNLRKAPTSDLRVRDAIAHAIDKRVAFDKAFYGLGRIATGPIASGTKWAYTPEVTRRARDLAKAKRLLDEAGYRPAPNGTRFTLTLHYDTAGEGNVFGEILRDQLREVGIALELRPMDAPAFYDKMFVQWDFDLGFAGGATGPDPAIGVARLYITSNIRRVPYTNASGYSNPEVDGLFEQGAKEPNPGKRAAIYRKVQEILVRDLPMLWLWEQAYPNAFRKQFVDVVSSPYSHLDLREGTWMRQAE